YSYSFIEKLDKTLRFLPRPADYLFLYFLSFFILLLVLKVDYKLAAVGALAFGFSTYYIIILGVGHNAKAHAIAYMPLVLAGILLVLKNKLLLGFVLTAIAMALEINASHPQMTYYLFFSVLILGLFYLIEAVKEKQVVSLLKRLGILLVAVILAVGVNASSLLATKEYATYSTRGKSELTINADGTEKKVTNGLSKDYITQYSYGIDETLNLFIPRFKGGGNAENVGTDSNIYDFLSEKTSVLQAKNFAENAPMYWGEQPIVEAPAYIGAVLLFLFVLGIFIVKGKLKKWLVGSFIFAIVLSWGHNFDVVTNFFINYVPLYNKFRAVSSIQVIAELVVPILAILALKNWFSKKYTADEKLKYLKYSVFICGGLALLILLFGSSFYSFESFRDETYNQMLPGLVEAIIADRKAVLFDDSLRTLILVLIAASLLWLSVKNKLKRNYAIVGFALLILFDLISVDSRYVNSDDFESARKIDKPYQASPVDNQILEDKGYYRVANFTVNPMNDGSTSYFHKSIGGYHAAKMGKYQELFNFHIANNNIEVLNMLNTKYFKFYNNNEEVAQLNPDANGNAWFVNTIKIVENANKEILALDSLKTKQEAVIQEKNSSTNLKQQYPIDSTAQIELTSYKANELTYKSTSTNEQFAVFSEIYYPHGWNAYINDELTPHYPVNYVLRGMEIPAGNNTIVFKFEPKVIEQGKTITLVSYILLLLIPLSWFAIRKKRE
ncbi:MAG TPA: YfhO family protein, partial [Flavobacteriaceae bacterium]|nr:YfhO family protein [Flavobacteriaceae bacterium]